ncbi:MAG: beta-lactamase family protein [Bacteroidia bacterium]|nr:beta-lactamase family protein [Bacteroidia bacterium]
MRNDSLIYSNGYGMANLEHSITNTSKTIYHIASVSKQFTAYSIVLLARQGKLNLDDDIRKYLTWFPDMKEKITIRNLLTHTSGIRDQWFLLTISGTKVDDVITQEQIIKILGNQKDLNFKPNEQALYSNSGYTILAEIIKNVSGKSLRQFADSAIFKPLNMQQTLYQDDYCEIIKNRSNSYSRKDSVSFSNIFLNSSNVGPSGILTNVIDMSKWISNFYNTKAGNKNDVETLTNSKTKLNNGAELDYAFGIQNGKYKGLRTYSHTGGDAGFRNKVTVFPDIKMGFIVLSNVDDFPVDEKLDAIADLFVKGEVPKNIKPKKTVIDSSKATLKNTRALTKYMGNYIDEDGGEMSFSINNKKMYFHYYGSTSLLKVEKDTAYVLSNPNTKFYFETNGKKDTLVNLYWPGDHKVFSKFNDIKDYSDKLLVEYVGKYFSPELNCYYKIALNNHNLVMSSDKYDDSIIYLKGTEHLFNESYWWMNHLKILRDPKDKINGFEVNSDRVIHLKFIKIE